MFEDKVKHLILNPESPETLWGHSACRLSKTAALHQPCRQSTHATSKCHFCSTMSQVSRGENLWFCWNHDNSVNICSTGCQKSKGCIGLRACWKIRMLACKLTFCYFRRSCSRYKWTLTALRVIPTWCTAAVLESAAAVLSPEPCIRLNLKKEDAYLFQASLLCKGLRWSPCWCAQWPPELVGWVKLGQGGLPQPLGW